MGWFSRLFPDRSLAQARFAAGEAHGRAEHAAAEFERWTGALRPTNAAHPIAARAHLAKAQAAAARDELAGWIEAREQFELARGAYCAGCEELALAHPKLAGRLLLSEAREAAVEISHPEERSHCAGEIGELQAGCGDVEGARLTLDAAREPADRFLVLRAIAIATGSFDDVLLAAGESVDDRVWSRDEIQFATVEERCQRRDIDAARSSAAPIELPEFRARASRCLAAAEARAGHWGEARSIASRIEAVAWRSAAWCDIARAQAEARDFASASKTADGIEDAEWRSTALVALASHMAAAGDLAGADALVNRLDDSDARDAALARIAAERAKRGDFAGALATTEQIEHPLSKVDELVDLAEIGRAAGQAQQAAECLTSAFEIAKTLYARSDRPQPALTRFIVQARSRLGDFDGAAAIVQVVQEEQERAGLLGTVALHLVQQHPRALTAMEELLERNPQALSRVAILQHGARGFLTRAAESSSDDAASSDVP